MEKTLLLLGFGCLGTGFALFKKARYYTNIFEDVDKAPTFSLDHIRALEDLPLQKNIFLGGTVSALDYELTTVDGKPSVINSYIPTTQQDHLNSTEQRVRFSLQGTPGDTNNNKANGENPGTFWVLVQKPPAPLYLYNLKKTSATAQQIQPRLNLSPWHRLRSTKYQEGALQCGKIGVAMGKLTKITDSQGYSYLKMEPQILLGENKQSLMQYLDKQIVNFTRRAKIGTGIGTAVIVCHITYKQYMKFTSDVVLPE